MKWVLVFFIGMANDQNVNLYGFPNLPFDSEQECRMLIYNFYSELQLKVNREYNTVGIQYPPLCITQEQFYEIAGKPT